MKLYHGSIKIIENPKEKGSKATNDYGSAFYLTRDLDSAHEWACRNGVVGIVNEYDYNPRDLKVLDLGDITKYSVLNWVAILFHFRELDSGFVKSFGKRLDYLEKNYYIDVNDYDVVIGPRADDAYFRFPLDFIRGNLTLEQLNYSFSLGKLGIQYALISQKAINHIRFNKAIESKEEYVDKYFYRVKEATDVFDSLDKDSDGTRILDIIKDK